jgi:hypothetical protein
MNAPSDFRNVLRIVGLGAPFDDLAALVKLPSFPTNPYAIVRQFWAQVQGRSWDQAMASANARAASQDWKPNDLASKNDLITLLVSTALNIKLAKDKNIGANEADNPPDTLARTWLIISKKMDLGIGSKEDVSKARSASVGNIEIGIPVIIVAVIAEAIIVVGVIAVLCYFASQVIDDVLAKAICDRELVRLHADYNKIVEFHANNPNVPWTQDEINARDRLLNQQQFVAAGCTKQKEGLPWAWWALGGSALTAGVLGVVYHKEIKDWIASRRAKS